MNQRAAVNIAADRVDEIPDMALLGEDLLKDFTDTNITVLSSIDSERQRARMRAITADAVPICEKRIANARETLSTSLADLAARRKTEKARHAEALKQAKAAHATAMADLGKEVDLARALAARSINADTAIIAGCKAALEHLG